MQPVLETKRWPRDRAPVQIQIREYFSFSARAVKMLRPRSDSNEPGGNLSQTWKQFEKTKHDRQRVFAMRSLTGNHAPMNENLHCLNEPGRPFATRLHFAQIVHGNRTGSQFPSQQIDGRDGVLNSEIDADAACR